MHPCVPLCMQLKAKIMEHRWLGQAQQQGLWVPSAGQAVTKCPLGHGKAQTQECELRQTRRP